MSFLWLFYKKKSKILSKFRIEEVVIDVKFYYNGIRKKERRGDGLKQIRFGIVGCGVISDWHARAIGEIEGAVLTGVTDIRQESAHAFG